MKRLATLILLLGSLTAQAQEHVSICFNYGCRSQTEVRFDDRQLLALSTLLGAAQNAEQEREAISQTVGRMLAWAGEQSPIRADRGGNVADGGVSGAMDCIDHSTTATHLLYLMEDKGWLRYHRVLDVANRKRFLLFDHFAAQIGEMRGELRGELEPLADPVANSSDESRIVARYVVDAWFFDNGHPAAVMPLERWMAGESPDVSE